MTASSTLGVACCLALVAFAGSPQDEPSGPPEREAMPLGAFSASLAVKDIEASIAFYEKLGFSNVGGKLEQNWVILRNGTTTIGLFQGMFEENILTFNPGWNAEAKPLEEFQDVREIQAHLKERGVKLIAEADPEGAGPASLVLADPDGNTILIDQHVPRPKR